MNMIITYKDHKRVCVKIRKPGWLLGVTDLSLWKPGIDAACAAYSVRFCCVYTLKGLLPHQDTEHFQDVPPTSIPTAIDANPLTV